jgi:hypothetical protein
MLERYHAASVRVIAGTMAAMMPWLAGCGSEQAGATSSGTAPGTQINRTISVAANSSAVKPRPKLQPGAKTVALARVGDRPYDKTFDDLRFEMTPGERFRRSMLTKQIEAMAGQRIRIRGFILPTPQKSGITTFVLVRDNQECCFGQGAALYDCILVEMKPGKTAEFSIRPVAAEGVFDIREFVVGGKHMAIYHLDAESVGGS